MILSRVSVAQMDRSLEKQTDIITYYCTNNTQYHFSSQVLQASKRCTSVICADPRGGDSLSLVVIKGDGETVWLKDDGDIVVHIYCLMSPLVCESHDLDKTWLIVSMRREISPSLSIDSR